VPHLHVSTHFSFGIGVSSPETLATAAAERGFSALACTDTNGVYGAVEFQRACEAAGVRPILGAHLVTDDEEGVALATDERGWAALCRAITRIHWEGGQADRQTGGPADRRTGGRGASLTIAPPFELSVFPPVRLSAGPPVRLSAFLALDRDGLILLSRDPAFLERVLRLSGPRDLYAELVPGKARHHVLAEARRLGLPSAVTNAVVMAHPEDWQRHRLLRAIHLNTTLSALDDADRPAGTTRFAGTRSDRLTVRPPDRLSPRDAWLRPADDLARQFPDCPEAVRAADEIAERCRYRIPVGRVVAPRFADAGDALQALRAHAYAGAERRYGTVAPVTQARLEHELAIIGAKGFADYFLVVRDIVEHAPTHCGRGSVANSIVSYCLGITHVEPLGAGLLFERFLNPERKDPPDIDLDFPWDERDDVLAYVFRRYPHPQAAMVANHNCFRLRGALREVAKVHGRPNGEIREVTRRIPAYEDLPLAEMLVTHPNFKALDLPPSWQEFARMAAPLVGLPRHLSLHPGGVVVVPTALTDYVPTEPAVKTLDGHPDLTVPVIQFEKDGAEDAGLVKIDLLGNRSLAVIRDAIAAVGAHTGHHIDYTSSDPGEDEPTRALFRTGQTMGVFYTESPASRLLCAKSRADTFELLVLNTSIIRPASNRYIKVYLERLHGAPYEPLDPVLRDTLAETFGVMVYQEDVVNVCHAFAGMSLASADGLRKSLSKKRPAKALAGYAEEFFSGALALGRDVETTKRVWAMIMSFAGYSFCKGHSASYIQVAQHSCYLRAHYPAEFMAAVLANGGGFYHPFAYVAEAMRMGLTVLPPDVNASDFRCTGEGRTVRIGLQFVKELSAEGAERLRAARGGKTEGRKDGRGGEGGAKRLSSRAERGILPGNGSSEVGKIPRSARDGSRARNASGLARDSVAFARPPYRPIALSPYRPFSSLADLRARTGLAPADLRALIKVGALDSISDGWTRPMLLWLVDSTADCVRSPDDRPGDWFDHLPPAVPVLKPYGAERRRREEHAAMGFTTDAHPMTLYADQLERFRLTPSTELHRHVGRHVLVAGMLTTAKPVHTLKDEPMEFATFDDGHGLIETVLFPDIYRERGHVLFDQGPFIFRGKVEEEFGAVTLTVTQLDRVERMLAKVTAARMPAPPSGRTGPSASRRES
jgi:error-prone DNA polymerase